MVQTGELLEFGRFRADVRKRALQRDGETVALAGKAFDVLLVLLKNAGSTVSKDELLKAVWPDTVVEESNLTQTVFVLRKALGDSESEPLIVTVPRVGYRFVGRVTGVGAVEEKKGFRVRGRVAVAGALAGVAAMVMAVVMGRGAGGRDSGVGEAIRFEVPWEEEAAPVLSPDGRRMAISPMPTAGGKKGIWIRDMNGTAPYEVPGTEGGTFAFWSADSCCLGFFAQGKLKTVGVPSGAVRVVADARLGRGGAWSASGMILFAPEPQGPLYAVPAGGGTPVAVTEVNQERNENSHRWPVFLPDGKRFLYLAHSPVNENLWLTLGEMGSRKGKPLVRSDSNAVFVEEGAGEGRILYLSRRMLFGQRFDLRRRGLVGEPQMMTKGLAYDAALRQGQFSASAGVLAYRQGRERQTKLEWIGRKGEALGEVGGAENVWQIHLSRDGKTVAGARMDGETGTGDIWTFDLERGGGTRITRHPAWESMPVLSPDGKEVVFGSDRSPGNAYVKAVDGAAEEQGLKGVKARQRNPYDWSGDGRFILFAVVEKFNEDLWVYDRETGKEYALADSRFNESQGQFSRDGKWVAYTSDETGRPEVYVREFVRPDRLGERRVKVSVEGGVEPRWRQDGKELFYVAPDGSLMAAGLDLGGGKAGKPEVVLRGRMRYGFGWHSSFQYAVGGNGERFLVVVEEAAGAVSPVMVVVNWRRGF